ncbi:uncharacterized protein ATC70_003275 [Mucor velutinosus]|uniref:Protein Zds1 C-terminal domain-containing protein n=1 Tax=Mucor velutinosus TaxID=708070 RepID=A0AAN7HYU1_9FUNG|nr:hypothetical protein ATC70_003275 [Mucor velutinosus]
MDIIEKVDIPSDNKDAVKLTAGMYQDSFILPSQSIINYDLTPLKFNDISSTEKDSEKVPPFVANLIDFSNENDDIMVANHATSNSASNSIWVPADKRPQISPNKYNDWIKIHTSDKHTSATVSRKRTVLSTLSFNATDDDSNSSGSNTSDEEEEPATPTTSNTMHLIPDTFAEKLKEDQPGKDSKEEANDQKITEALLCRQANRIEQEASLNQMENNLSIQLEQPPPMHKQSTTPQPKEQTPINVPRVVITAKSPDTLNADSHSKKDRKSWFSGLLQDLKKTSKPQKSKKAGLSSLFSRSSSPSSSSRKQETTQTKSSNTVKTQQTSPSSSSLSLSPTKPSNAKPKKKKLESEVSKHTMTRRDTPPLPQRYPHSTERAIYRLSHVKLGNPRRPLQQQVAISNMMYWYLSIQQQEQQQQFQQQQQLQQNYYYNKRQQIYFNNIYQATYQSFEPPTPGGGYHQHQPHLHSYPTTPASHHHQQQQLSYYANLSVQQQYDESYHTTSSTTEKPKTNKKKFKPVRNTQYDPMVFENSVGIQNLQ